jgi:hypothetical protein
MGIETAIIAAAVIGAGTSAVLANQNKPSIPKDVAKPDTKEPDTMASDRQDRARKQAIAATGRTDTLLTGPQGLGDMSGGMGATGNTGTPGTQPIGKTLLGQ